MRNKSGKMMKHLIRLSDWDKHDARQVFQMADALRAGKYPKVLEGQTVVLFFPESSIRTRVTFERGIHLLGGQSILFPPSALDKKEDLRDVEGYLSNWAAALVVRHKHIAVTERLAEHADIPVINAMTDINHPCEVLSDCYALSKIYGDIAKLNILFVGAGGNIGLAWKEAADLFGFDLAQSCPPPYAMEGVRQIPDLRQAAAGRNVICTDSLTPDKLPDFADYQVTSDIMRLTDNGILNPCPPFYRGEEVSAEVLESQEEYFVNYDFKSCLMEVQQAVLLYCLGL